MVARRLEQRLQVIDRDVVPNPDADPRSRHGLARKGPVRGIEVDSACCRTYSDSEIVDHEGGALSS